MGTCGCNISNMEQTWGTRTDHITLRYPDGAVAGCIGFYEARQTDGSIRAQLELRFENNPSAFRAPELRLDAERYAPRWSGVMVEMEPRQSESDSLRFRIDIPSQTRSASPDVRPEETTLAEFITAGTIVSEVRKGCGYPNCRPDCLCEMAKDRAMRELADDRSFTELVTLASQSLHAQGPGTRQ
jgi:hypothetical protein